MNTQKYTANKVVLCICTFRRTALVSSLLPELGKQIRTLSNWSIRIVIVDNDINESAGPAVQLFANEFEDLSVQYICEPAVGVGNARNAGFEALQQDEAIIFFDDDQHPSSTWLYELIDKYERFPKEILVGPVIPVLPDGSPEWTRGAWAWGRRELPDGSTRKQAGFGNILIPASAASLALCRVPTEFLQGPGEDTVLSTILAKSGVVIRQVAAAKAYEPVSIDRLSVEWVRERARISGQTWVRVVRSTGGSSVRLALSSLKLAFSLAILKFRSVLTDDPTSEVKAAVIRSRLRGYIESIFHRK